jgi:NAD(P)-dependent dehydrogenase (short-subunit alcohol dehydrogenase family)
MTNEDDAVAGGSSVGEDTRVVLVTGGARGLGAGIARRFLADGATVITCGRTEPDALPAVGDRVASFISCDVRDRDAVAALVDGIAGEHGRLDVLVNNAGGSPRADAATASPRFFAAIVDLNLTAAFTCAQAANAAMQEQDTGGVIVNIASVSGLRASPGTAAYGAAKAGLINLTRTLAVEWAPKVRVVAVTPGLVGTDTAVEHYGTDDVRAAVAATVPLGRFATEDDIAAAVTWMASPDAAYATGSNLVLDGGGEWPAFLTAHEQALARQQPAD